MTIPTTPDQARELANRIDGGYQMSKFASAGDLRVQQSHDSLCATDALRSLAAQVEALTAERDKAVAHGQSAWSRGNASGYASNEQAMRKMEETLRTERVESNRTNELLTDAVEQAEAERDSLRAELDKLKNQKPVAWRWVWKSKPYDIEGWCYTSTPPRSPELQEIETLYLAAGAQPAEIEALRADAARYRWMRNKTFTSDWNVCAYKSVEYVDAYIDAAKAAS